MDFKDSTITWLLQDNVKNLSDSDVASLASVITRSPKSSIVTATTLASVWGFGPAASLLASLRAAVTLGQQPGASSQVQQFGAGCDLTLGVLLGPGLQPSDPQAQGAAAQFIAAGIVTQDQIDQVFYTLSYPVVDGPLTTSQVTQYRAQIVFIAGYSALKLAADSAYSAYLNEILNPAKAAGTDSNTLQTFKAYVASLN